MQSSPNRSESASTTTRPAPCSVGDDQRRAGGRGAGVGAGQHPRAVAGGDRGRAVQAGGADARRAGRRRGRGRRRRARRGSSSARRGSARSPGRCRSPGAGRSAPSSSLRLLPYFSCSVSPSTISPPPPRTNASIASSSSGAQPRRAGAGRALPGRIGGVGDHEHVAVAQRRRRSSGDPDVGRDGEVALRQRRGGQARRRRRRVGGLHRAGQLGADRPRLAVGLVEQDSGERSWRPDVASGARRLSMPKSM